MSSKDARASALFPPQDMILLVGWGDLSSWVVELCKMVATQASSPFFAEWVGPADDLSDLGFGGMRPPRLVMTQAPGSHMIKAIGSPSVRIIVVVEEPKEATDYCRQSIGTTPIASLRAVSHSMTAHMVFRGRPCVDFIYRSKSLKARDEVERIVGHFGLSLDAAGWRGLLDTFCGNEREALSLDQAVARTKFGPKPLPPNEGAEGTALDRDAIARAFYPVVRMSVGHPAEPIIWDRSLFYTGTQADQPAPRVFDLTGPPRQLFGGPLLHVPSCTYDIDICFKFDGVDPLPFRIEFCWLGAPDGPPPVQMRIEKAPTGRYRASMRLTLDRPQDVLDIRVTSLEAAIDGELELEHISLTPLLG
jgi:hypothetical protein